MKNWYSIKAQGKTGEILIYDYIGMDPWTGEGVGAAQFDKDMKALSDTDEIIVRINSPGGDVFDGTAIQNMLVQAPQRITVHVDGIAASAASFIAMAGDEIVMPENAMMMIHNASGLTYGDYRAHQETIDALTSVGNAMRSTYRKRTGLDDETLQTMLDETTWMDGAESVRLGFADTLTEPVRMAACAGFPQILDKMHERIPEWVKERFAAIEVAGQQPEDRGSGKGRLVRLREQLEARKN